MGNYRKRTAELSCADIKALKAARDCAKDIGLELNTHITFAPYSDGGEVLLSPDEIARNSRRLLKHLTIWVKRRSRRQFTYISIVHTDEDGSGRNPHLHILMHLPNAKLRDELQAMLIARYGYTAAGGLVAMVRDGFEPILHESGYWSSTFNYLVRFMTQQAYVANGRRMWRASRCDEKGRHVGIKCPFIGRRWNTSRNINAKARQTYNEAKRKALTAARIAGERKQLTA